MLALDITHRKVGVRSVVLNLWVINTKGVIEHFWGSIDYRIFGYVTRKYLWNYFTFGEWSFMCVIIFFHLYNTTPSVTY